jgi:hypothetical protein
VATVMVAPYLAFLVLLVSSVMTAEWTFARLCGLIGTGRDELSRHNAAVFARTLSYVLSSFVYFILFFFRRPFEVEYADFGGGGCGWLALIILTAGIGAGADLFQRDDNAVAHWRI